MRVAIIDDDTWVRRGREAVLVEAGIEVAFASDHAAALADPATFDEIDIVLVDAHDSDATFDRFPGVKVVEAIRRRRPAPSITIVVITGHVLDDVLRLRMADAGADALYGQSDIRTAEQLVALVRDPLSGPVAPPPSPAELAALGLGRRPQPNEALDYIREQGLEEAFSSAGEGESQKSLPAGRRQVLSARRRVGELLGVRPDDPRASVADWRSIVRIVDRLRGR